MSVPEGYASSIGALSYHNVRLVLSGKKAQVAQRAAGFREATCEYVMQLDDDMYFRRDCLEKLVREAERRGPMCALAPVFVYTDTGISCQARIGRPPPSWLEKKIHGSDLSAAGRITPAGRHLNLDFPPSTEDSSFESEWLAGGCVLHYRKNLVLTDYYPFVAGRDTIKRGRGKEYGEDVIHSVLLRQRGVRLFVVPGAVCSMDRAIASRLSIPNSLRQIYDEFRWRRYLVGLIDGSELRLASDILHTYSRHLLPGLIRRMRDGGLLTNKKRSTPEGSPIS
ncbi:MAG TPA: glycosyltransferase [Gemmatimonadaceae bacterium]|nr:glycosyltransferase [Gemmatimonadaceae bacterium]